MYFATMLVCNITVPSVHTIHCAYNGNPKQGDREGLSDFRMLIGWLGEVTARVPRTVVTVTGSVIPEC